MYKNFWNSLLLSPAILGAALVVSATANAKEALAVKEEAKPQTVEAQIQELSKDTPSVNTTPMIANAWATKLEGLASNDESPTLMSMNDRSPVPTDLDRASLSVVVNSPDAPTANSSSASSVVAEVPVDASNDSVLEQIDQYSNESAADPLDQVTNVTQLTDVRPTDWAYEALRSLVERYGCIVGYPDRTYRGNRALSRYEFAAGLNACLNQIERLIASSTADFVRKSDLETLQRLVQEFRTELTTLGARLDKLEGRVAFLEDNQFSTTTKLNGEVIFALADVLAGNTVNGTRVSKNTVLGDRVRLNFDTSFTGKDVLRTRLQALNLDAFSGSSNYTPEGDLRFAGGAFETGNNNDVGLDALLYAFPIGEKTTVVIEANAGAPDDFTNTVNPLLDGDGANGALTHFGTRNPIYYLLNGTGLGLRHQFSDNFELSLGYLANDAANPEEKGGLFDGPYGALAQLTIKPFNQLTLGLTYIHAYNNDFTANGSSGSNRANLRSTLLDNENVLGVLEPFSGLSLATSTNAYGIQASFQLNPGFIINGWAGYTATRTLAPLVATNGAVLGRGDYSTWNFAVNLAFPNLGKEGNLAAIIFGMEPKVTGVSRSLENVIGEDSDTSLHIEALYQYKVTDNISITPGIIWLTAPDHNSNNDDIVIGTIRTTFTF
jgi:hypothetical protein